ncbi:SurA N-terminal domain-containing protein [Neisseria perflava]|uniref:SurA N-terminal domain-containing protein n=1 Tax=Neisseria perflava TaxID=33053 RepID=UPI00209F69E3|nr:SurA N-terminal domain-containing protein [Neisseria perflava]MCP1660432.1 peptidyl-prolyl cis-trans isomerase D [Neisseria perflava]MCP1772114.1 peptidyl-prolyl cis-trans isomerase D [Neisseria perflava]
MFHAVEKYKTPAQILLGLIALTFVGFGVSTVASPGSDYIVKVGDEKISEHELNTAAQNTQGQPRDAVLQALVQRAYLTQGAKMMGIAVSQEQIKQIIVDDPNFHNASGKFEQALLTQYLSQRNMTEDQFVEEIREQFALQNLLNLVQNGSIISDAQAEQLVKLTQSTRTIRSITFSPEAFAANIKTDDGSLQRYYDAHKKDYVIPQGVKIEYVALSAADLAEKQTVSAEEVRKAFDEQAASATPRREIAHIFFPVAQNADDNARNAVKAEAEKVLAQVQAKPADFAALAKKYSQDPASAAKGGNLGLMAKDGGLLPEFENTAFSMQKGETSNLVQTQAGFHIIRVLDIQDKPVFEQEKARIEAELKLKKAAAAFNSAKEKLAEEAFNNPNSLEAAAKSLGLKITAPEDWLTRANGKAAGMPDDLLNAIFSDDVLKKKHNSEPVSVNDDTVWIVRAKEVREEKTAPFAEIKDDVRMGYLRSEATKAAEKKAQETLADLKTGHKTELPWSPVTQLTAQQARQSMPPQAYAELIKARPAEGKPAYVLLQGLPAPVIIEVQAISAPSDIAAQLPVAKQAMLQQQTASIFDNLLQYLSKNIKQEQGAQKVDSGS